MHTVGGGSGGGGGGGGDCGGGASPAVATFDVLDRANGIAVEVLGTKVRRR